MNKIIGWILIAIPLYALLYMATGMNFVAATMGFVFTSICILSLFGDIALLLKD